MIDIVKKQTSQISLIIIKLTMSLVLCWALGAVLALILGTGGSDSGGCVGSYSGDCVGSDSGGFCWL